MALERYDVLVGKYRTTMQLSAKDAKARGLTNADKTSVRAAKAREAAGKASGAKQGRQPANKAAAPSETK